MSKANHTVSFNRHECTWQVERTTNGGKRVIVEYRSERQARILAELMNAFERLESFEYCPTPYSEGMTS
jgi:hypothetical protein